MNIMVTRINYEELGDSIRGLLDRDVYHVDTLDVRSVIYVKSGAVFIRVAVASYNESNYSDVIIEEEPQRIDNSQRFNENVELIKKYREDLQKVAGELEIKLTRENSSKRVIYI